MAKILKGQKIQIDDYINQTGAIRLANLTESQFMFDYNSPTDKLKVYVNPPNLKASSFAGLANRNRILAWADQEPSKAWLSWFDKNKLTINVFNVYNKADLVKTLVSRTSLTRGAAELLVDLKGVKPIQSYYWTIQSLNDVSLNKSINEDRLLELLEGELDLSASKIKKSLGKASSLSLIKKLESNRAMPLLAYLEKSETNPTIKQFLEITRQLIINKEMSPKIALIWFVNIRYQWELNKKTTLLSSLGMDFLELV